jgi:hypothetical protein
MARLLIPNFELFGLTALIYDLRLTSNAQPDISHECLQVEGTSQRKKRLSTDILFGAQGRTSYPRKKGSTDDVLKTINVELSIRKRNAEEAKHACCRSVKTAALTEL